VRRSTAAKGGTSMERAALEQARALFIQGGQAKDKTAGIRGEVTRR